MIAAVITAIVALPNYHEDEPLPKTAIWRLAATAVAVGVDMLAAACLLPVTARDIFRALMAQTLEGTAWLMRAATGSLVPREHRPRWRGGAAAAPEQSPLDRMSQALFRNAAVLAGAEGSSGSVIPKSAPSRPSTASTAPSTPLAGPSDSRATVFELARAGASVYVALPATGQYKLVGRTYLAIQPRLKRHGLGIAAMKALEQPLRYEFYALSAVKRFPFPAAQRALLLLRQMVNIAGSFSAALDTHEVSSCPPLIPVAKELELVRRQMDACLGGLAGFVKQDVELQRWSGGSCGGVVVVMIVLKGVLGRRLFGFSSSKYGEWGIIILSLYPCTSLFLDHSRLLYTSPPSLL